MTYLQHRHHAFIASISSLFLALITVSSISFAAEAKKEPWELAMETEVWEPVPPIVAAPPGVPPSDAIVLFNGANLDKWQSVDGKTAQWKIKKKELTVVPKTGDIRTRESFCDVQLHIEWRSPKNVAGKEGQGRGNSGIFFQERYEVQVLDSFENKTYPNGQVASVYKQSIPLANASRGPDEWQVYDIIFMAPKFDNQDVLVSPATVTVLHNGVLVQNHFEIEGPTEWIGKPPYTAHGCAPLRLQDHNDPVSFRNIWIRKL